MNRSHQVLKTETFEFLWFILLRNDFPESLNLEHSIFLEKIFARFFQGRNAEGYLVFSASGTESGIVYLDANICFGACTGNTESFLPKTSRNKLLRHTNEDDADLDKSSGKGHLPGGHI